MPQNCGGLPERQLCGACAATWEPTGMFAAFIHSGCVAPIRAARSLGRHPGGGGAADLRALFGWHRQDCGGAMPAPVRLPPLHRRLHRDHESGRPGDEVPGVPPGRGMQERVSVGKRH